VIDAAVAAEADVGRAKVAPGFLDAFVAIVSDVVIGGACSVNPG
jgi:hypothetical protein